MKFAVLLFLALVALCIAAPEKPKLYTTKYDNVDVDSILTNARILSNYIKCLLDDGPCTPDGRELKKTLPDALQTGCEKCNEKQKTTSEKVIRHLMKERPRDWDKLVKKYDPNGQFKKRYDELVAKQQEGTTTKA
uniref:Chemosensory protein n=1 Tax=Blattella germanica TaxID=6973 RepID=A0A110A072_BLAGE|nr:chemosensory protein [Blattella germanica]